MFLEIVFCSILLVIGTDSIDDFCTEVLSRPVFTGIRNPLSVYEDKNGDKHCFFRLPKKDEDDSKILGTKLNIPITDVGGWKWKKQNAIDHCHRFNKATLPLITDADIASFFNNGTKDIVNETYDNAVLLGVKTIEGRSGMVNVTWVNNRFQQIDADKIHGSNHKIKFRYGDGISRIVAYCEDDVDMKANGEWTCYQKTIGYEPPRKGPDPGVVFCQIIIPATTTSSGHPRLQGVTTSSGRVTTDASCFILKLIISATTALMINHML